MLKRYVDENEESPVWLYLARSGGGVGSSLFREGERMRIVVKLGTGLLTRADHLDRPRISELVRQIGQLRHQDQEVALVSSGAIFAGRELLGRSKRRKDIPYKQMLAAAGQVRLMALYQELFEQHNVRVAQALLTRADLTHRESYLNARNTLLSLLEAGLVPVINENDVVAIEEIKIGDNDNLSALVANLIDADRLILLTDQSGFFTSDPRRDPNARLIRQVDRIDENIQRLAASSASPHGTGGMVTKLEAAELATRSGTEVVIASGNTKDVLLRLAEGEALGTLFATTFSRLESRKRWILAESARGKVGIDEGAAQALLRRGKSLLAAGVSSVTGNFERGATVELCDLENRELARGIANYSSTDLERIRGRQSREIATILGYQYGPTVVHRDNLVVVNSNEGESSHDCGTSRKGRAGTEKRPASLYSEHAD